MIGTTAYHNSDYVNSEIDDDDDDISMTDYSNKLDQILKDRMAERIEQYRTSVFSSETE